MMMKVLICGSREWRDASHIAERVDQLPAGALVIHGKEEKGADRLAGEAAKKRGLHVAEVEALWEVYGRPKAGGIRNAAMLELAPHFVIAFSIHTTGLPTAGTAGMITLASSRRIPVELHNGNGSVQMMGPWPADLRLAARPQHAEQLF
jgi:hypothetical protein